MGTHMIMYAESRTECNSWLDAAGDDLYLSVVRSAPPPPLFPTSSSGLGSTIQSSISLIEDCATVFIPLTWCVCSE